MSNKKVRDSSRMINVTRKVRLIINLIIKDLRHEYIVDGIVFDKLIVPVYLEYP